MGREEVAKPVLTCSRPQLDKPFELRPQISWSRNKLFPAIVCLISWPVESSHIIIITNSCIKPLSFAVHCSRGIDNKNTHLQKQVFCSCLIHFYISNSQCGIIHVVAVQLTLVDRMSKWMNEWVNQWTNKAIGKASTSVSWNTCSRWSGRTHTINREILPGGGECYEGK